ncbi:MAG TPA: nicotinate-nucleotide--dimethylbenzimidazole phosphoribosyltransferase [Polyangiaceae bacterium]|nr:nicotinate-nucleotide--dimethylbenzimidazole phosphoribosyltransferase [Polyangiaceae bacterium]
MTTKPLSAAERAGVYRAIYERRDIRNYKPDAVPDDVLGRILDAAHHAPSVGWMQPWDFVLVRDGELRRRIYDHFVDVNRRAAAVHSDGRGEKYRALKLQGILDAPLNLLVTCDRRRGGPHVLGRFTQRHTDEYSTCLAVQNLWLAARAEGVGVGWMSLFEPEVVAQALRLPEDVVPVAYLTLGYPVSFPDEPMLRTTGWAERRPLADAVFIDRYGERGPAAPLGRSAAGLDAASNVPASVGSAASTARARQDALTKPVGSLGRLEALALQLATLQQGEYPTCNAPSLLLFAADHGVAEEGVSAYLPLATAQMVYQYLAGGAAVNVLCRQHDIRLLIADVGVDHDFGAASGLWQRKVRRGTRNFLHAPAMDADELAAALAAGAELVAQVPESEAIGLGEMGIGNTTAAAAMLAALTGLSADEVVGRGTGVSSATLERKRDVVRAALGAHAPVDATDALRRLGGFEIAALVGAIEAAARAGRLVVLDGFITGVAALVARERDPAVMRHLVAGHVSAEGAHRRLLERLGLRPLLDLDLRLGEGSGAVLGLSLLQSSVRLMREMRTFEEANLARPLDPRDAGRTGA